MQVTNDWSSGDLELVGLDAADQPVSGTSLVSLSDPYESHVASLHTMTVTKVKLTTSTQQVKLIEVDFCGGTTTQQLDLAASSATCESLAASWRHQAGADHQISVVNSAGAQFDSQRGLVNSYGPVTLDAGTYTVTLTARSLTAALLTETVTVTVRL